MTKQSKYTSEQFYEKLEQVQEIIDALDTEDRNIYRQCLGARELDDDIIEWPDDD